MQIVASHIAGIGIKDMKKTLSKQYLMIVFFGGIAPEMA